MAVTFRKFIEVSVFKFICDLFQVVLTQRFSATKAIIFLAIARARTHTPQEIPFTIKCECTLLCVSVPATWSYSKEMG